MARPTAGGSGIRTILVPLPHTRSTPVAVLFTQVGYVCAGGFEDAQAEQPEHGHEGEIAWVRRLTCDGEQGLNLEMGEP
jgi:hypothetical protein